ncbi:MAG: zinc ribbon domain-containing protein [Clostridia bacterium]|nr:zinc ribbon domain-containing protein [Clostridia bacterium]
MFCKNCGQKIEDNAKFCKECGFVNDVVLSEENQRADGNDNAARLKTQSSNKNLITTIFILIIALLSITLISLLVKDNSNSNVDIGPIYASDSVIRWYSVDSVKDEYNLYTPYIENGYLYIDIETQINASNTVQYRGFGSASVTDTYDKVVPIKYEYEKSTVTKGEYQDITIRVPLQDLDVQKPTTLYCKLAVYYAGNHKDINLEFNISW